MINVLALFQNLFLIGVSIIGIGFIICFHEFGHFIFAKLFNVYVPSFSIGFGPRILSKKIGDTLFSISAIPLGGYVEMAYSPETDDENQKKTPLNKNLYFNSKPFYQKFLIMFGGIIFNFIFAYTALSFLFMAGMPKSELLYPRNATATVSVIREGSSSEKAGLKVEDEILEINDNPTNNTAKSAFDLLKPLANTKAKLLIKRKGSIKRIILPVEERSILGAPSGFLPVLFEIQALPRYSFIDSIKQGISLTNAYTKNIMFAFKHIFAKRDTSSMGGPIAIISATMKGVAKGFKIFLLFLVILNLNIAVLNLLPLPILDGGQILFHSIEAAIGRPVPIKIKEYIFMASWGFFLLLTLYLGAKDIITLVKSYLGS